MSIRQARLIVGAITLMFGGGYLWQSVLLDFGTMDQPGAALFPTIMAVIVMLSAVVVVVEELTGGGSEGQVEVPVGNDRRKMLGFFGCLLGYVLLLPWLGQLLTSFVVTTALVRILGGRSWLASGLIGAAIAVVSYFLFVEVLGVSMPDGLLAPDLY